MNIYEPIDRKYPKVKPLAQALVQAAAEQGATMEEFELACERIKGEFERKASGILVSELQGDGEAAF